MLHTEHLFKRIGLQSRYLIIRHGDTVSLKAYIRSDC